MNSFCVEEQISDIVLSTVLSILHLGPYREDDALGMTPEKMFLHICDAQPGEDKYVPYLRNKYIIKYSHSHSQSITLPTTLPGIGRSPRHRDRVD